MLIAWLSASVGRWRLLRKILGLIIRRLSIVLLIILRLSSLLLITLILLRILLLHVCSLILEVRVGQEEGAGLLTAN